MLVYHLWDELLHQLASSGIDEALCWIDDMESPIAIPVDLGWDWVRACPA
jgi:hypothetical protein